MFSLASKLIESICSLDLSLRRWCYTFESRVWIVLASLLFKKISFWDAAEIFRPKKSVIFGFFFDLRRLKVSGLRIESLNGAETGGNLPLCKHRVLLLNFFFKCLGWKEVGWAGDDSLTRGIPSTITQRTFYHGNCWDEKILHKVTNTAGVVSKIFEALGQAQEHMERGGEFLGLNRRRKVGTRTATAAAFKNRPRTIEISSL